MLTQEQNDRLCRVGPGTPMGELFRRYWQPVAGVSELEDEPTKDVRLLGEDLVVYKDGSGRYGLITAHCPHRKASLAYGIPEPEGLRCPYHGWMFDNTGQCIDQPAELEGSRFKERVKVPAYPVEELGGLLWAYMGPDPKPLLPRYDIFVDDDGWRDVGVADVPCNWLQCMENSVDMTHVDHLHGRYFDYVLERMGRPPRKERVFDGRKHLKLGFSLDEHGIVKHRVLEGDDETADTWKGAAGYIVFPNMTIAGGFQIRVPVDDYRTKLFLYSFYRPGDDGPVPAQDRIPVYDVPYLDENGKFIVDGVTYQDTMVMITQGAIMDRTTEMLGASDQGIVYFRNVLQDQLEAIESGEDPLGVMRDPAKNDRVDLPRGERRSSATHMDTHWGRYSPIYAEAKALVLRKATPEAVGGR